LNVELRHLTAADRPHQLIGSNLGKAGSARVMITIPRMSVDAS
jgi:hypothetical protein